MNGWNFTCVNAVQRSKPIFRTEIRCKLYNSRKCTMLKIASRTTQWHPRARPRAPCMSYEWRLPHTIHSSIIWRCLPLYVLCCIVFVERDNRSEFTETRNVACCMWCVANWNSMCEDNRQQFPCYTQKLDHSNGLNAFTDLFSLFMPCAQCARRPKEKHRHEKFALHSHIFRKLRYWTMLLYSYALDAHQTWPTKETRINNVVYVCIWRSAHFIVDDFGMDTQ